MCSLDTAAKSLSASCLTRMNVRQVRWEGSASVLDPTSRRPTERNAVDMPGSVRRSRNLVRNAG